MAIRDAPNAAAGRPGWFLHVPTSGSELAYLDGHGLRISATSGRAVRGLLRYALVAASAAFGSVMGFKVAWPSMLYGGVLLGSFEAVVGLFLMLSTILFGLGTALLKQPERAPSFTLFGLALGIAAAAILAYNQLVNIGS